MGVTTRAPRSLSNRLKVVQYCVLPANRWEPQPSASESHQIIWTPHPSVPSN